MVDDGVRESWRKGRTDHISPVNYCGESGFYSEQAGKPPEALGQRKDLV